ncbi:MAG: transcriptional regulator [Cyclobacteriaceae bacterium]|nr:MAG: transcriptional regulator [Cyclobacteriaceae bacterium]
MPTKPTTQLKKSERTRRLIVEKAAPLFNKQGYWGTSLQDIIEATGLTKGSIYGNFSGKDELAVAVFKHNSHYILRKVKSITQSDNNASRKLFMITDFYRQYIYSPELSGGCPILNTATEADDSHPDLKDLALEALDYVRRSFIHILNNGIRSGEFNPEIEVEQTATLFLGLIEGGILQTKLYNKSKYLLDCLNHIDQTVKEMCMQK